MNKTLKVGLGLLLSSTLLMACGNGDTEGEQGGTAGDKTVVRFATWDNDESLDAQQTVVDRFNESQDEIEVRLEGLGADFDQVLTTGMGAGDAPDVMYMWNYPLYHEGLEPLDSFIAEEGEDYKDNFYDALWNYNQIDDTIYGIPVGYTTHALFYNTDLFDEAGLDYPTSEWTWDDAHEAAQEISALGDDTNGFVWAGKPDPYDFEMFLWSNGTEYTSEDGTMDGHVNSSESVEVFKTFQDMIKDGSAIVSEGYGTDEMKSDNTGMFIYGAWGINSLDTAGINYGITEIPSFDGQESASITSSSGLAMASTSENKDAAWEFIKFWTNEENNIERMAFELPVLESVVESENLEEDELRAPFYSMLERSVDFSPTSFNIENWTRMSEELSLSFEEIFNPTTLNDPEEVLNRVAESQ